MVTFQVTNIKLINLGKNELARISKVILEKLNLPIREHLIQTYGYIVRTSI